MEYQIQTKNEFYAIGLELSGAYSELQKMGQLWDTFVSRIPEIQHPVNPKEKQSLGLTNDRPTDFTYYAAIQVSSIDRVPEGMEAVKIPTHTYAVFTHKGLVSKLGETIGLARQTLSEDGKKIDHEAFWFELYGTRFNPTSEDSELELYFPILS